MELRAKCAVTEERQAPATVPQMLLHAAPAAASRAKELGEGISGASMSRVRPTSLTALQAARGAMSDGGSPGD